MTSDTAESVHILLVDDDIALCDMLTQYLQAEGFEVDMEHNGRSGAESAIAGAYDIIVLDVMLPELNGFEALKKIRTKSGTPVLMLTARGDDVDRIVGLEIGADDYLAKPCNPRELVARLRAILRRTRGIPGSSSTPEKLRLGDVELDPGSRNVMRDGETIQLTGVEFTILQLLLQEVGQVVSKTTLCEVALGRKLTAYDRSVDTHVSNIRKKLGPDPSGSKRIKTIRGIGYLYVQV